MNHIQIHEESPWRGIGSVLGLIGGYLADRRESRGVSKELENNVIDREVAKNNKQLGLVSQLANNWGLGEKANPDVTNQLMAQANGLGLTGITRDNVDQYRQGLVDRQNYFGNFNPNATWAERNANGGVGRSNYYLNHAPSIYGGYNG